MEKMPIEVRYEVTYELSNGENIFDLIEKQFIKSSNDQNLMSQIKSAKKDNK